MVALLLWYKYSTVSIVSTPSGWTSPASNETAGGAGGAGVDTGVGRAKVFFRQYDGVWAMPTIDLSAAPNVSLCGAISYTKDSNEVWAAMVCANAADTTGSTTAYDSGVAAADLNIDNGDWLCALTGINGDAGTVGTVTLDEAGATLGTLQARWNAGTATGQDARSLCHDRPVTAGPSSAGPRMQIAYTAANASMAGASIFWRLRVNPDSPAARSAFVAPSRAAVRAASW
jgi:hypothetical protein